MTTALSTPALAQLFTAARSQHNFSSRPIGDELIEQLYELLKWGPTAFNGQPARYVFLRSATARQQLAPALSAGNRDKTLAAPLTVIVAYDTAFHEQLPSQFPAFDAKGLYDSLPQLIEPGARTNATLQAGYLILAARALGLAAGPMSGFDAEGVDDIFFADGRYKSLLLVNLGYADGAVAFPRGPRLAFDEVARVY
ncbi:malonic semialdehyde reductase [Vogesella sp. LIG4]|uniref:malonic semialdehyde reductase n=1 Tax=Vogesella sp. LIG4 TaxID=1192162 RepID=UPI00081FDEC5|nr:malonic semialdehyde reductase [Vogesella sp. LIG4]SCK26720.1 3-hydroxypropanoate dehydrogenase [Vogesella sp. LIG4]